jgi:hypothetical protein
VPLGAVPEEVPAANPEPQVPLSAIGGVVATFFARNPSGEDARQHRERGCIGARIGDPEVETALAVAADIDVQAASDSRGSSVSR